MRKTQGPPGRRAPRVETDAPARFAAGAAFFRRPALFELLRRELVPDLLAGRPAWTPLRAWVIGCATGAELYSLGMALLEALDGHPSPPALQLFGTDSREAAVATARAGTYPDEALAGVSPERRRRFFSPVEGGARVSRSLRDACVFARHDLLVDPPFSHMDLVSVSALPPEAQPAALQRVQYALAGGGYLALEEASVAPSVELSSPVDRGLQVYRRRADAPSVRFGSEAVSPSRTDPPEATASDELGALRARLAAALRERDAAQERLIGLAEEAASSAEELQSVNDELECAKEELEATNDELHRGNQRLLEVNGVLDGVLSSVDLPIVLLGRDLTIQRFTAAAQQILGLRASDTGRPLTDLSWSTQVPDLDLRLRRVLATAVPEESHLRGPDERQHTLWLRPYLGPAGRVDGTLVVLLDVTARARAEDARLRLELELQEAQRLEGLALLAVGVAHDFNNLLTGVMGNAELARESLPADAPQQARLQQVTLAAQHAADLARQLLAYAGQGVQVVAPIDLTRLARETIPLLRQVVARGATVRLELEEGLPSIAADVAQVRQVVMNLLINAAEASRPGDAAPEITVRTRLERADQARLACAELGRDLPAGDFVALEVEDAGCGMSDEVRRRIFQPFYSTKFTGRGLGLAAVHGIARAHRGAIFVRSAPGRGATFTVLFPATAGRPPVPAQATPAPAAKASRERTRVLVVDDDLSVGAVARALLEREGFEVAVTTSGLEATATLAAAPSAFDVALVDLTMPRLGGEETVARLRALRPDLPVVVMSGYSPDKALPARLRALGAGFINKPFNARDLVAQLRVVIDGA